MMAAGGVRGAVVAEPQRRAGGGQDRVDLEGREAGVGSGALPRVGRVAQLGGEQGAPGPVLAGQRVAHRARPAVEDGQVRRPEAAARSVARSSAASRVSLVAGWGVPKRPAAHQAVRTSAWPRSSPGSERCRSAPHRAARPPPAAPSCAPPRTLRRARSRSVSECPARICRTRSAAAGCPPSAGTAEPGQSGQCGQRAHLSHRQL
jgi:hypothetical protein